MTSSGAFFDSNCRNLWMTCYTAEAFYFERCLVKLRAGISSVVSTYFWSYSVDGYITLGQQN